MATTQIAKGLGARTIAVTSTAEKAAHALEAGAEAAFDLSSDKDLNTFVRNLNGGQGARWAFDPVGGELINRLLQALAFRSTLVLLGFTGGMQPVFDAFEVIAGEKRIEGYSVHAESDADAAEALKAVVELAANGHIKPRVDSVSEMEALEEGRAQGSVVLRLS